VDRVAVGLSALLAAALLAGFACGGDGDGGGAAPTATSTESPSGEVKTDAGVTDTEIKLGQHVALSGDQAAEYAPVVTALKAYFGYVNSQGGVCDRKITLISEDDQSSPAIALEKAKKLAEQDKVAAFVGNLGTPPNTGSARYINEQGIPDLFLATGVNQFADVSALPWTVLFNPDYASEGTILANYVNGNFSGKTVAILYQNDDFGKTGRDAFVDSVKGQVVAEESYESTATDINSQIANLRNATPEADVLYLYSTPAFTARAYAYMLQNDWKPQVVMSYVNPASTLAGLVGGDAGAAEGFRRIAGAITNNYLLDPVASATDPAIQEHTQIMADNGGPPVGSLTVYAQALAETVVQALEIACENGDLTRQGIMDAAESIGGFHPSTLLEGIDITLGDDDHSAVQSLLPVQVQADGTLEPLADAPIEADSPASP
jgi:ABC-type branched-subunit amino acid transport system substrate-binding protein